MGGHEDQFCIGVVGPTSVTSHLLLLLLEGAGIHKNDVLVYHHTRHHVAKRDGFQHTADARQLADMASIILVGDVEILADLCHSHQGNPLGRGHLVLSVDEQASVEEIASIARRCDRISRAKLLNSSMWMSQFSSGCTYRDIDMVRNILQMSVPSSQGFLHVDNDKQFRIYEALISSASVALLLLLESHVDAGAMEGLTRENASSIILQTCYSTLSTCESMDSTPAAVRQVMCSPGSPACFANKSLEKHNVRYAYMCSVSSSAHPKYHPKSSSRTASSKHLKSDYVGESLALDQPSGRSGDFKDITERRSQWDFRSDNLSRNARSQCTNSRNKFHDPVQSLLGAGPTWPRTEGLLSNSQDNSQQAHIVKSSTNFGHRHAASDTKPEKDRAHFKGPPLTAYFPMKPSVSNVESELNQHGRTREDLARDADTGKIDSRAATSTSFRTSPFQEKSAYGPQISRLNPRVGAIGVGDSSRESVNSGVDNEKVFVGPVGRLTSHHPRENMSESSSVEASQQVPRLVKEKSIEKEVSKQPLLKESSIAATVENMEQVRSSQGDRSSGVHQLVSMDLSNLPKSSYFKQRLASRRVPEG